MGPYYDTALSKHRDDLHEAEKGRRFRRPTDRHPWLTGFGITGVLVLVVLG